MSWLTSTRAIEVEHDGTTYAVEFDARYRCGDDWSFEAEADGPSYIGIVTDEADITVTLAELPADTRTAIVEAMHADVRDFTPPAVGYDWISREEAP